MRAIRGVYAIADTGVIPPQGFVSTVARALAGGVQILQYRSKLTDRRQRLRQAAELAALCRRTDTLFIINDDVHLAAEVGADGVHMGRDDPTVEYARAVLGDKRLIGLSCYNELSLAIEGFQRGVDYVAFGSFHPSTVKPDAVHATPALLQRARRCLDLPIVAIGGITPENGAALIKAGADALAVISAVFATPDPRAAAARFSALFTQPE